MRSRSFAALPLFALALAVLATTLVPRSSAAAADTPAHFASVGGHLSIGYSKLFVRHRESGPEDIASETPGGSISLSGGLDTPVTSDWRVGLDVGYHLLGSRTVERGSLFATLDYSVFEAIAFAHWQPMFGGPIGRLSFGPALVAAKGELSASGAGAAFSDLSVSEVAPGFALQATLISRKPTPVRIGFELGAHVAQLKKETWTLATARVTAHY
jgi:hypothetical protein